MLICQPAKSLIRGPRCPVYLKAQAALYFRTERQHRAVIYNLH